MAAEPFMHLDQFVRGDSVKNDMNRDTRFNPVSDLVKKGMEIR